MNTRQRNPAHDFDMDDLLDYLKGLTMTGEQAAELVDALYDCIKDSDYMLIGSVDLNDIAGRMKHEIEAVEVTE